MFVLYSFSILQFLLGMGPIFCSGSISMEVIPSKGSGFNSQASAVSNTMYFPFSPLLYFRQYEAVEFPTKLGVASNEINSTLHDFYSLPQDPRVLFLHVFLFLESCCKSTR